MGTREDILNVAARLLAENGVEATSTRAICEAAGVTQPTLYHYFGDKEGLLAAVVTDGFERFLAQKRLSLQGNDPIENLRRGWDTYVAFGVEHPALYSLVFSHAARAVTSDASREAFGMLLRLLGEVQLAGRLRVELALAAQMYWSGAHGVTSLLVSRSGYTWDPQLSTRVREALLADLVILPDNTDNNRPAPPASTDEHNSS
ncbi:MAG TPA: TetR/AcrR family transcriptional regulator [Ktedonobacteraceae bacterium]|nr:TetR/AcrR family transcriptional regulator [Ktedonobacteraceae bacterium]